MSDNIYQHYRPDEQNYIDTVFDWIHQVDRNYAPYCTVFLNPRQRMILEQLVRPYEDIKFHSYGGYLGAERRQTCLYPTYYHVSHSDLNLALLKINYPIKFGQLSHGKILGTFMSQGIDRERIGDIITDGTAWHAVVDSSIASYLINSVTKIANVGVHLEQISFDDILTSNEEWEIKEVIASSLRLDTLLSKVYNFSRQRAKDVVAHGQAKVNFVVMERPDIEICLNDIVSLRKFGRFRINSIDGMTKKENYRLTVDVLIK